MMKKRIKVLLGLIVVVFTVCAIFSTVLPTTFAAETVTNVQMLDMCNNADNFIDANGRIPQIVYTDAGHTDSVTAAEFYYMMSRWLRWYKNNNNTPPNTVSIIRGTAGPSTPSGTESGQIQLADILTKGQTNADFIDANSQLPNYSTVGSTQYTTKAIFWVFARTIQWYRDNGSMPNYATVREVDPPASWTGGSTPSPTPTPATWARTIADVPYYHQPDGYTCGPTSLSMVIDYFGPYYSAYTIGYYMRDYLGDSPWYDGVVKNTITAAAKHYGFSNAHGTTGWTALKAAIAAGIPAIAYVKSWINPDGTHYVVVVGLTKNSSGDCNTVIVNDPSNSGYLTRSFSDFDSHWSYCSRWIMVIN